MLLLCFALSPPLFQGKRVTATEAWERQRQVRFLVQTWILPCLIFFLFPTSIFSSIVYLSLLHVHFSFPSSLWRLNPELCTCSVHTLSPTIHITELIHLSAAWGCGHIRWEGLSSATMLFQWEEGQGEAPVSRGTLEAPWAAFSSLKESGSRK